MGLFIIGTILVSGAASAATLANTPQPKIYHDNQNTCLSPYNGPENNGTKWKYKTGNEIPSSPVIGSDGTIYIGSYDDYLYALNPNGTKKWKYETGSAIYSSPIIDSDGNIYIASEDGSVYSLFKNGTLKWKLELSTNTIFSSPAIATDGTLYVGSTDNSLYAINPNGTIKWKYQTSSPIYSSPAIATDGTIYIGSNDNNLYAIKPDGTPKWTEPFKTNGLVESSPVITADGTIYIGSSDGNEYAVNPDGSLKWNHAVGSIFATSAIGSDGTIYFGSTDNKLYALNPDGTEKWSYSTSGPIFTAPLISHNNTIYIGSMDCYLYAINPDGSLKWKYLTGNYIESTAALGSDGTLYFGGDDGYLYAVHTDTTAPSVNPSLKAGLHNTNKKIYLNISELGTIYYTLNGTNPTKASYRYTGPITITKTCTLKYFAIDLTGNISKISTQTYTIDKTIPKVISTNPVKNAVNVSRTSPIYIKFSEGILASTNYSKIYIKNLKTGKIATISKTIKGNVLTIKHSSFKSKTYYQVYIPVSAVKDKAGNKMAKSYTYKFRSV